MNPRRLLASPWLHALVLVVAVGVLYAKTRTHAFVYVDVSDYLLDNTHVQHGFDAESLRWAWTTFYASNWHPLTWMSHMLDCQLFGLEPAGHNLVSVAWHAANSVLALFLVRALTGRPGVAFFVAACFAREHHTAAFVDVEIGQSRREDGACFRFLARLRDRNEQFVGTHVRRQIRAGFVQPLVSIDVIDAPLVQGECEKLNNSVSAKVALRFQFFPYFLWVISRAFRRKLGTS